MNCGNVNHRNNIIFTCKFLKQTEHTMSARERIYSKKKQQINKSGLRVSEYVNKQLVYASVLQAIYLSMV